MLGVPDSSCVMLFTGYGFGKFADLFDLEFENRRQQRLGEGKRGDTGDSRSSPLSGGVLEMLVRWFVGSFEGDWPRRTFYTCDVGLDTIGVRCLLSRCLMTPSTSGGTGHVQLVL